MVPRRPLPPSTTSAYPIQTNKPAAAGTTPHAGRDPLQLKSDRHNLRCADVFCSCIDRASRASTSPAAPPPSGGSAPPPVRVAVPPQSPAGPLRPVIEVRPNTPRVRDTAPGGTVVARYSVRMSDNSPFTGTVRFGPPYYDNNGRFALAGSNIIVNPDGPGIGPNKATITGHITLKAIPKGRAGR